LRAVAATTASRVWRRGARRRRYSGHRQADDRRAEQTGPDVGVLDVERVDDAREHFAADQVAQHPDRCELGGGGADQTGHAPAASSPVGRKRATRSPISARSPATTSGMTTAEGLDFLRESLGWVVQELMEAEVSELIGAERADAGVVSCPQTS
jgi:hypothetical protein